MNIASQIFFAHGYCKFSLKYIGEGGGEGGGEANSAGVGGEGGGEANSAGVAFA